MKIENDASVLKILQNEVKTAVQNSLTPDLPIHFVGRTFEKPSDGKYLELVFIPNNQDDFWSEDVSIQGMFRLILHQPIDDAGAYGPYEEIASIAEHFKKSTPLHGDDLSLQIYQKPTVGGMIPKDSENLFPAKISYRNLQL